MSTPVTAFDILGAAFALIREEARWCRGWYAQASDGKDVDVLSSAATRFCVNGALHRITEGAVSEERRRAGLAMDKASHRLYGIGAARANDTHGHAAALAILMAARESVREGVR